MEYTIEIEGLDEVIQMLNDFENIISSDGLKEYLAEKSIKEINKIAKERLANSSNYIESNKYEIGKDYILIYNDVQNENSHYSLIIEYGSGLKMDNSKAEHFGNTPEFRQSGYEYWINGLGIRVTGQEPKYIYTDAAKIIEKNITSWANEYIDKEMK